MSKSGVIGHFESKNDLQLAILDAARALFEREVLGGLDAEPGIDRLRAMAESWIRYVESDHFSGGCFFLGCLRRVRWTGPERCEIA